MGGVVSSILGGASQAGAQPVAASGTEEAAALEALRARQAKAVSGRSTNLTGATGDTGEATLSVSKALGL